MANVKQWAKEYWYVGVIVLVLAGWWLWQQRTPRAAELAPVIEEQSQSLSSSQSRAVVSASQVVTQAGVVHIKGAVAKPGIYPVTGKTRWADVVTQAGGLTSKADVTQVNLAKIASDQESLYIPNVGETPPPTDGTGVTTGAVTGGVVGGGDVADTAVLDLNEATEADLQQLSGIGPKRAADIIAYRDGHGGFKSIEELKEVSGIGEKIFASLAPQVKVSP